MNIKSLFFKVFFWLWLALILIFASTTALTIMIESGPWFSIWRQAMEENLALVGQHAVARYEKEGKAAPLIQLTGLPSGSITKFMIYDAAVREISGRKTTPEMDRITRMALKRKRLVFRYRRGKLVTALCLTSAGGNRYVIVRQVAGGGITGLLARSFPSLVSKLILMGILSCVLSLLLTRTITDPIFKLQRAVNRFASGDFKVRAASFMGNRGDEIGRLAADFDRMAHKIQDLMDTQKNLLRDISHELRSPLARLTIALDLLRRDPRFSDNKYLDQMEKEAGRINRLIEQILNIVRLKNTPAIPRATRVDLASLVQNILSIARIEAERLHIDIHAELKKNVFVYGGKDLLHSAIENVVLNAIYYAAAKTGVEVSLTHQTTANHRFAVLRVRDHGPGVPEKNINDIFRPFFRLDDARKRRREGTGLGLSIAEHAVRLHKGNIECANATGGGLVVQIRLPATDR